MYPTVTRKFLGAESDQRGAAGLHTMTRVLLVNLERNHYTEIPPRNIIFIVATSLMASGMHMIGYEKVKRHFNTKLLLGDGLRRE